ncbi:hypothetical protein N431DRAFT_326718 [Stipitochalara longipes BDJ]|nr:hypothetical protein N431DRAFT_326718 [Stipitochalara longipes BDJ]
MVQRVLHEYFPSVRSCDVTASPKRTFLHLPQKIRRRIYLDVGLVSEYPIHLNYLAEVEHSCVQDYDPDYPELWPVEDEDRITFRSKSLSHFLDGPVPWPKIQLNRHCSCLEDRATWCECDPLPYQLLYVSKVIGNEVSAIFYSENHFAIFRNRLGGLYALGSLSHKALSQMTSLSIYLNVAEEDDRSEILNTYSFPQCHKMCSASKVKWAFRKEKGWDEIVSFREWQRLWKVLRPSIKPNRLKLFLTCDMADIELAHEFLQPLFRKPTLQLRECSIRLASEFLMPGNTYCQTPDCFQELAALAKLNVQLVTEQLITNQSMQSFKYRDLPKEIRLQILEHTELVSPFDLAWTSKSRFYEYRAFPHGTNQSAMCCQKCTPMADACACFLRRGAFSTTCTCWKMPIHFFLVDHQMKEDAEFVFYSNNHFLLSSGAIRNLKNLVIYDFLTHLPRNGRRYLHSLSLECVSGDVRLPDSRGMEQWQECLNIINDEMNSRQLSLTIDLGFDKRSVYYYYGGDYEHVPDICYTREAEKVWTVGKGLVDSLVGHAQLKNLFFHFMWPFEDCEEDIPRDRGMVLEKMVMGENYESNTRGKTERRHRWNGYQCDKDEECLVCS